MSVFRLDPLRVREAALEFRRNAVNLDGDILKITAIIAGPGGVISTGWIESSAVPGTPSQLAFEAFWNKARAELMALSVALSNMGTRMDAFTTQAQGTDHL